MLAGRLGEGCCTAVRPRRRERIETRVALGLWRVTCKLECELKEGGTSGSDRGLGRGKRVPGLPP
eukprot:755145-Hanusia_phi.AAC.8